MISSFDEQTISNLGTFLDKCPYLGKVKMAAFLVSRKEKVISFGHNSITLNSQVKVIESLTGGRLSFRKEKTRIGTLHAEMACFAKFNFSYKHIRGTTLYVRGVSRSNNTLKSRPCPICMKLCSILGVERVVYSTKRNGIDEEIL